MTNFNRDIVDLKFEPTVRLGFYCLCFVFTSITINETPVGDLDVGNDLSFGGRLII